VARRHPYDAAADGELAHWPGVTWERPPPGRKTLALAITYAGATRRVHYPITPSDSGKGALNHVQDVRRTLRDMGAQRRGNT